MSTSSSRLRNLVPVGAIGTEDASAAGGPNGSAAAYDYSYNDDDVVADKLIDRFRLNTEIFMLGLELE
ncbi:hypothetical protein Tco_1521066 [Tanacetum coccineum]